MTSLVLEQFVAPDSDRAVRRLELTRRRAADDLAGRTVWCVALADRARPVADALRNRLGALCDGMTSRSIPIQGDPSRARAAEDGDGLLGDDVRAGDLVVLHDPIAATLADAVRARGAHAIWRLPPERPADTSPWPSEERNRPQADAYLMAWRRSGPHGARRIGIAAFMAGPDVVLVKEMGPRSTPPGYGQLGWTTLLAEVATEDHDEHVGGTLQPRPRVAAR